MKLAIVLGLLLCAIPAKADSISILAHASFVDWQLINGTPTNLGFVESFDTSFDYDTLSNQTSAMTTSATGLLGNSFAYAGVNEIGGNELDFIWSNPAALVNLFVSPSNFPTPGHPIGVADWGTKSLQIACQNQQCMKDFSGLYNPDDSDTVTGATWLGASDPTATPEPSSLILLGIGLLGVVFMSRKLIVSG